MKPLPIRPNDCSASCDCQASSPTRRDFLKLGGGLAAAGLLAGPAAAMAGPFEAADFARWVPADKKLNPDWVASLFARGRRTVYRGAELELIGMPIGGLCAGQLYLGGDGRLWHWDIFNQKINTGGSHYAHPPEPDFPLEQGFILRWKAGGKEDSRPLDHRGFADITFCGEYPIGYVEYRDKDVPLAVSLEAFSPFIPLDADDSSLPATVLEFTVKNTGTVALEAGLVGFLENVIGRRVPGASLIRHNRIARGPDLLGLECSVEGRAEPPATERKPIVLADFEGPDYGEWKVEGAAPGKGPSHGAFNPNQHLRGFLGKGLVNTWQGNDGLKGKLTSPPFTIQRRFISFLIAGGNHPGQTCINLLVDGKIVRSSTGKNTDQLEWESWNVEPLAGKTAQIEIVDDHSGGWGHIDVDQIEQRDRPRGFSGKLEEQPDVGTMTLALLRPAVADEGRADLVAEEREMASRLVTGGSAAEASDGDLAGKLIGSLCRNLSLAPGQETKGAFVIAWRFPNLPMKDGGRYYAAKFASATAVARHVAGNFDKLAAQTRLWHDTWYDSTLPYWFLDRTMANTSVLATSTSHRFQTGRFYGWEGVGCCEGTCTHVWHYAHAVARLFPELERDLRRRTDFGLAQNPETGVINHRGEGAGLAVDGQAGCILRAYREHQMSADGALLQALWPRIKLAMQCLINMDNGQGLVVGAQHNTLDQPWFGKVAWLSSLYIAAARACEEMALEVGDRDFARQARAVFERGSRSIDRELFNGQYYCHIPDAEHVKTVGSHDGCEIDQVFGQSWAWQVALGRILSEQNVKQALASLWRYNFAPDVGPFRADHKPGRWYAMPGEAGLLMCSWPKGEAARQEKGFDFYFNECMNGFEYQVAGHMLWEGMVQEGLAVTRAVHDRYHAARRNPWNEVECGDHYARSMASYGVFLAACGYEYHGPKGHLAFAPRLTPDDFRAAFTTAEGWGTLSQKAEAGVRKVGIDLKWGRLRLRTLGLTLPAGVKPGRVAVTLGDKPIAARLAVADGRVTVTLADETMIESGQRLSVAIT